MKLFIQTVILSLFISISALAQASSESEVEKSMSSLSTAIIAADQNMLDSLTLSELIYGHSDDRIQNIWPTPCCGHIPDAT